MVFVSMMSFLLNYLNFRLERFNSQLKETFTLDFKEHNNTLTDVISKGIFDMYKAHEKLKSSSPCYKHLIKDKRKKLKPCPPPQIPLPPPF